MYIRVQCTWICKKCESYYVIARRFQNNRRGANTPLSEYSLSSLVLKSLDKLTNSLFKNSNSCKTEVAQVARSCLSVHNVPASFYLKLCLLELPKSIPPRHIEDVLSSQLTSIRDLFSTNVLHISTKYFKNNNWQPGKNRPTYLRVKSEVIF